MANSMRQSQETESVCPRIEISIENEDLIEKTLIDVDSSQMLQPQKISGVNKDPRTGVLSKAKNPVKEQFDGFLIEAIDEALSALGQPVKNTLYRNLEYDFKITKKDIPRKILEFSDILHRIFGMGASRLEIRFMKNLNSRVQADVECLAFEWPLSEWFVMDMSFPDYVNKMFENYESLKMKKL